jgi:hypothetical protein
MVLRFSPLMKKRLTPRALAMIERALGYFPELSNRTITVGYTRSHLGSASWGYHRGEVARLTIRLKVRKLTHQTIGHELTHLVQGLCRGRHNLKTPFGEGTIPSGEKQCDVWTLARNPLFCDDPPSYLRLPRMVRDRWPDYAEKIRQLCIAAIEKRQTYRCYIRWLESEIRKAGESPSQKPNELGQLSLPFAG